MSLCMIRTYVCINKSFLWINKRFLLGSKPHSILWMKCNVTVTHKNSFLSTELLVHICIICRTIDLTTFSLLVLLYILATVPTQQLWRYISMTYYFLVNKILQPTFILFCLLSRYHCIKKCLLLFYLKPISPPTHYTTPHDSISTMISW